MTAIVRPRAGAGVRALALLRLTRPWFWPLGWAGAYFGFVLAAGRWVPPVLDDPAAVAAVVVLGPLVWGAVLAMNDLYDLPNDRRSPRKSTAPLVTGVLTEADLRWAYRICCLAAMAISVAAGPWFVAGTAIVLVLGWLYSTPPVRLKARPGADVAVNTLVVGVFAQLGGWSLHRSILDYPPVLVLLGVLLGAALYIPTTVMDRDADLAAGDMTFAVRLSPRACYWIGLTLWTAANVIWLACCHLNVLVTRDDWTLQTVAAPVLVAVYAVATRKPSIPRMAVVSVAFAVPGTDFLRAAVG